MGTSTDVITERLRRAGHRYLATDNISAHLDPQDVDAIEGAVAYHAERLLEALIIDTQHDPNTKDTAQRFARMLVREAFAGRYAPMPRVAFFPNHGRDEMTVVGPIEIRSACAHHLVPIQGHVWVGIIPGENVIGLSKFARLAEWVFSRPQIQEDAAIQLTDVLQAATEPQGIAVVVKAKHLCCGWRGVKDRGQSMTSSVMRGTFFTDAQCRNEFLSLISDMRAE